MAKIQKRQKEEIEDIVLTYGQKEELAKEFTEIGKEKFLQKRGAIRVEENGDWIVLERVGLMGTPADFGYNYFNDIPYNFWAIILSKVYSFIRYRKNVEKSKMKSLENLAQEHYGN